jgi:dipeptidyl-peptidase-4
VDVYRVRLDGSGLERLSSEAGTHSPLFNKQLTHYIDTWSDLTTPIQTRLMDSSGAQVRVIDANPADQLAALKLPQPELLKVSTRDGFEMEAILIKPPDFDPTRKYPVMSHTYSGPHAPRVVNRWGGDAYLWHQYLAQQGYLIWICDNRTASGKGAVSAWPLHRNFGELELRDLEDGLDWLKQQPWVDGTRIGLWGWSFGGYMTSYALTHSNSFKLGIAGAPVTDWLLYDTVYTERYMGTPQNNPEGYRKSSVLKAAGNLSGKLLLVHGTTDDNVHLQNTIQFIYQLQLAGKEFEMMLYPRNRHGFTNQAQIYHMRKLMTDFIEKGL